MYHRVCMRMISTMRTHPELKFDKNLVFIVLIISYILFDFVWLCLGHLIVFNFFPCLF